MKVVGNSRFQKVANAFLILRILRKGPLSRVVIAKELGLQPSTVTYSINRLFEAGIVQECSLAVSSESNTGKAQKSTSTQGRKAIMLELNRDFGWVIGLELLADYCWACIMDVTGTVLVSTKVEYVDWIGDTAQQRFESLVSYMVDLMVSQCKDIPILGVGIAVPGIVSPNGHLVEECWTHDLRSCDFSDFLEKKFPFPVIIENDANCCVQKYLWNESENPCESFMYLLVRKYPKERLPQEVPAFGIGLGLVFNGILYRGAYSRSGEFKSALLSHPGVNDQLSVSKDELARLDQDDDVKKRVLNELLANLASAVSILDPRTVYLGGYLAQEQLLVRSLLEDRDSSIIKRVIFADAHADTAEGAAKNLLDILFRIPQVGEADSDSWRWEHILTKNK